MKHCKYAYWFNKTSSLLKQTCDADQYWSQHIGSNIDQHFFIKINN